MNEKITSVKNHITRNRGKYAFAAGFVACFAITNGARKEWNTFLDENDLTDKFYCPAED